MTTNKRTPTEGETLLLRVLAEIREILGVGGRPMLSELPGIVRKKMAEIADANEGLTAAYIKGVADQREETRKVVAENKKLRRVVVAYLAKEEAEEEARPEWSSADPTPQACLDWIKKMDELEGELEDALLDSGMVYPIKA